MHFEVDAIAQVTSVPVARGEQLARLFRLHHTPLAGHKHDGVEIFSSGAGFCFSAAVPRGGWVLPK